MHGIIGKIVALPGKRDELRGLLAEGCIVLPGCTSYVVAEDIDEIDVLWITEIWESAEAHSTALRSPGFLDIVTRIKPTTASIDRVATTHPVAGA
ncbi:putative quinol monooxygenase [Pseudoroseicyclus sp. H15]